MGHPPGRGRLRPAPREPAHRDAAEDVRLRLGRTLALGLEFTLAAVTLLRTLLNLFLEREIRAGEARHGEADRAAATG